MASVSPVSSAAVAPLSTAAVADYVPEDGYVPARSTLSDKAIMHHLRVTGKVCIEPFTPHHLSTSSYDVTLGRYFYRESMPEPGSGIYNPYSPAMVTRVWGEPKEAEEAGEWMARTGGKLENIAPSDRVIWLQPGETILGHTNEFLGGRGTVTTMMKARSSMGRNFIEVCKCAGWGDIGYVNRWTMEITNNSRYYSIPLVVGRRIAQIVFLDTDGTLAGRSYEQGGKYQSGALTDTAALIAAWQPSDMLPRMYADREVQQGSSNEVQTPRNAHSPNKHAKAQQNE